MPNFDEARLQELHNREHERIMEQVALQVNRYKIPKVERNDMSLDRFLNSSVYDVTRQRGKPKNGTLFGVELEMEGKNTRMDGVGRYGEFVFHADPSLRDNHGDSAEWVLNRPLSLERSKAAVTELFTGLRASGSVIVPSMRTSTHVHYNMGDKQAYQVVNLFLLCTVLEDILGEYCGDGRNGNLNCLSNRQAEYNLDLFNQCCFDQGSFTGFVDNLRYSYLNLASLNKYFTVEFRGMRGLDNANDVNEWLDVIDEVTKYAMNMGNPFEELVLDVSMKGVTRWLKDIFSYPIYQKLVSGRDDNDIEMSVYEGLRLIQMTASRVGEVWGKVKKKEPDFWEAKAAEVEEKNEWDIPPERIVANPFRDRIRPNPFDEVAIPAPPAPLPVKPAYLGNKITGSRGALNGHRAPYLGGMAEVWNGDWYKVEEGF